MKPRPLLTERQVGMLAVLKQEVPGFAANVVPGSAWTSSIIVPITRSTMPPKCGRPGGSIHKRF
jgi:hypothetical protein